MSDTDASSALLIDTHILVWMVTADRRLKTPIRNALMDAGARLCVSAVIAWEYADLHERGRIPGAAFPTVCAELSCEVLPLPADLWSLAGKLPEIHGDPTDRMLIAHAISAGLTLVSADRNIARYPVPLLR
jgi:PIN domain nuclease of toxin-antitoxin system